jgi:hypothetical protein
MIAWQPGNLKEVRVAQGELLLYGSGRTVVIRKLSDPLQAELWTGHAKDVTVQPCTPSARARRAVARDGCGARRGYVAYTIARRHSGWHG